jgi:hypothetical protein
MIIRGFVKRRIDLRSDAGFIGGTEVLPFGILIFVAGTLMIMNLWAVLDTKMAVDGASREGARAVAESDGRPDADSKAEAAATASLSAHNRTFNGTISIGYPEANDPWRPCAPATVMVEQRVPLINLPFLGAMGGPDVAVRSTHSELVDPYRSRATGIDNVNGVSCG